MSIITHLCFKMLFKKTEVILTNVMHTEAYKVLDFVLPYNFYSLDFNEIQMPCEEA